MNRQAKRVRIMIARRGKVQAVGSPEATNPLVPVGRWNAAFQITSATAMRCAQVPDVIRAGDDGLGWDVNPGSRFTIGAFACLTGAANPTTGVATATCRAGGRAFQVQERFIG